MPLHDGTPLVGRDPDEDRPGRSPGPSRRSFLAVVVAGVVVVAGFAVMGGGEPKLEQPAPTLPAVTDDTSDGPPRGRLAASNLQWERTVGLENVVTIGDATVHDGRLWLVGRDVDDRLVVASSDEGQEWVGHSPPGGHDDAPVDLRRAEGIGPVAYIASVGSGERDEVLVVGSRDGDRSAADAPPSVWWSRDGEEWNRSPLPISRPDRAPEHAEADYTITGIDAAEGGLMVTATRVLATPEGTLDDPRIPAEWGRVAESSSWTYLALQRGVATLYVDPFQVGTVELSGSGDGEGPSYRLQETLAWSGDVTDRLGSIDVPPGFRVAGSLGDGIYGTDGTGQLIVHPRGVPRPGIDTGFEVLQPSSDGVGGTQMTSFAGGWLALGTRSVSFTDGVTEWTPISPESLAGDDMFLTGMTTSSLGVATLMRTHDRIDPSDLSIEVDSDEGHAITFDPVSGTTTIAHDDGSTLAELDTSRHPGEASPVTLEGDLMVFRAGDNGQGENDARNEGGDGRIVARVGVTRWIEEWEAAHEELGRPAAGDTAVVHSPDGSSWGVVPVSQITEGETRLARQAHLVGDVALLVAEVDDSPVVWVGTESSS